MPIAGVTAAAMLTSQAATARGEAQAGRVDAAAAALVPPARQRPATATPTATPTTAPMLAQAAGTRAEAQDLYDQAKAEVRRLTGLLAVVRKERAAAEGRRREQLDEAIMALSAGRARRAMIVRELTAGLEAVDPTVVARLRAESETAAAITKHGHTLLTQARLAQAHDGRPDPVGPAAPVVVARPGPEPGPEPRAAPEPARAGLAERRSPAVPEVPPADAPEPVAPSATAAPGSGVSAPVPAPASSVAQPRPLESSPASPVDSSPAAPRWTPTPLPPPTVPEAEPAPAPAAATPAEPPPARDPAPAPAAAPASVPVADQVPPQAAPGWTPRPAVPATRSAPASPAQTAPPARASAATAPLPAVPAPPPQPRIGGAAAASTPADPTPGAPTGGGLGALDAPPPPSAPAPAAALAAAPAERDAVSDSLGRTLPSPPPVQATGPAALPPAGSGPFRRGGPADWAPAVNPLARPPGDPSVTVHPDYAGPMPAYRAITPAMGQPEISTPPAPPTPAAPLGAPPGAATVSPDAQGGPLRTPGAGASFQPGALPPAQARAYAAGLLPRTRSLELPPPGAPLPRPMGAPAPVSAPQPSVPPWPEAPGAATAPDPAVPPWPGSSTADPAPQAAPVATSAPEPAVPPWPGRPNATGATGIAGGPDTGDSSRDSNREPAQREPAQRESVAAAPPPPAPVAEPAPLPEGPRPARVRPFESSDEGAGAPADPAPREQFSRIAAQVEAQHAKAKDILGQVDPVRADLVRRMEALPSDDPRRPGLAEVRDIITTAEGSLKDAVAKYEALSRQLSFVLGSDGGGSGWTPEDAARQAIAASTQANKGVNGLKLAMARFEEVMTQGPGGPGQAAPGGGAQ
ncbi:hypothetical protein [Roseospira goensis]|uniref:Uncharacterized protein n=1 Tax=Roseospira goensis TaxID=391922 RepID=A0A7W6WM13_9PROT|nr:hypothetical protein [Roseospira goensis]MBB4287027.1 hypothetical protein [Roseospira goensis]